MVHEFGPFRYDASQRLLFREGEALFARLAADHSS
jgi:hypothetical protein